MHVENLNFQDSEQISHWLPYITRVKIDSQPAAVQDIVRAIKIRTMMKRREEIWDSYQPFVPSDIPLPQIFTQWHNPPDNDFQLGMVVGSFNENGLFCTAIVSALHGPRIRISFSSTVHAWTMCDSDNIYPLCCPHPQAAPIEVFNRPPYRPSKNHFRPGDRLETVSVRFPSRVVPAVIQQVFGEFVNVFIPNECYSFICQYYSRNLFPVGWCKRANIELWGSGHTRLHIPYILGNMSPYTQYTYTRNKYVAYGSYIRLNSTPYGQLEMWSINEVAAFLAMCEPMIASYAETFRTANIDGLSLLFITPITMLKEMGVKLGSAIKIRVLVNILAGKPWQTIADY